MSASIHYIRKIKESSSIFIDLIVYIIHNYKYNLNAKHISVSFHCLYITLINYRKSNKYGLKKSSSLHLLKMFSSKSLVIVLWGFVGFNLGLLYSLSLRKYNFVDKSHLTLNHQSHMKTAWENWVPLGHKNVACLPSMSQ